MVRYLVVLIAVALFQLSCSGRSTSSVDSGAAVDLGKGSDGGDGPVIQTDMSQASDLDLPPDIVPPPPPCDPCTEPALCCPQHEMICYGDPDKGVICTCLKLWDCSGDPNTCQQGKPQPTYPGSWTCSWTVTSYTCTQPGSSGNPPSGVVAGWSCNFDSASSAWLCTLSDPPNPCNTPAGLAWWTCTVDNAVDMITCKKPNTTPPPPCSQGTWSCSTNPSGLELRKRTDQAGLPASGSSWTCHQANTTGKQDWICHGSAATSPSGGGWTCQPAGPGLHRCEQPVDSCEKPTGAGPWQCVKGSSFGGTQCEKSSGTKCIPGQVQWCDGLVYGGWGQVTCDANGAWKTVVVNGKPIPDCQELGGAVPDTVCACYHYFFNPTCCTRADCVMPVGGAPQTCPQSQAQLCDYCNPLKPECTASGAKCLVTNSSETFCGQDCASQPCPGGYSCMTVMLKTGSAKQCAPTDLSCYF